MILPSLRRVHLFALAGLVLSGAAQAALHDRGGGLVYDDVLNVTWLGDANYAQTSGYDADGQMTWSEATTWAANLVYHDSVRNVDFSDWRLPTVVDTGSAGCDSAYSGTDCGYNVQTVSGSTVYSELAHMYYNNLGFKSYFSPTGAWPVADSGISGNGTWGSERDNLGPNGAIDNLQSYEYWSGTAYAPNPATNAWYFSDFGLQDWNGQGAQYSAWAVRDGDVAAAVPEPESYAMFLAGLGLVGGVARRRQVVRAS